MIKAGLETIARYAANDFDVLGISIIAIITCLVDTNCLSRVKAKEDRIIRF